MSTNIEAREKFDAAVVLGAAVWSKNKASPILEMRIRKASELYFQGSTGKIYLTGSNAPGEFSEAKVAKREILKLGVPERVIEIEEKTNSTLEQIIFINEELKNKKRLERIAVVTDGFHLLRTAEIAKFHNLNLTFVKTDNKLSLGSEIWFRIRESVSLILYWLFGI